MTTLNVAAFQQKSAPKEPEVEKIDWQTLDVDSLGDDLREAYYAYRKAQDAANKLRLTFEEAMSGKVELASHLRLAFGYKFGKISVAIVKAEKPASKKASLSLAELIRRAG